MRRERYLARETITCSEGGRLSVIWFFVRSMPNNYYRNLSYQVILGTPFTSHLIIKYGCGKSADRFPM